MELTADELAGVVDVFDALTRSELTRALSELAFKRAAELDDPDGAIDDAVAAYHLVEFEPDDDEDGDCVESGGGATSDGRAERVLVPGPAAFPDIPDGAEDLPHIVDLPDRDVDRDRVADAVAERFREETVVALRSEDPAFVDRLLDVSYELEAWGPVDVSGARERLADAEGGLG